MPVIEIHISSKDWEKAPVHIKERGEEIRILKFTEDEFFFEKDKNKVSIEFGCGRIKASWERMHKELNKFLGEVE